MTPDTQYPVPIDPHLFLPHPQGDERAAWMGNIEDEELDDLVSITVRVPKKLLVIIDELIQWVPSGYNSLRSKFVRHALHHLLLSWQMSEQLDDPELAGRIREVVEHAALTRQASQRIAARQDYADTLRTHERNMSDAVETGDWELIERTLGLIQHQIDTTPDPHWQTYIQHLVARSPVVRLAVSQLYDAKPDDQRVKYWQTWLEALS